MKRKYIEICDNLRVFYVPPPEGEQSSFDAEVVELDSWDPKDPWGQNADYEVVLTVSAFWDGVRHINWYPDNDGYTNYPNFFLTNQILMVLNELELRFCEESSYYPHDNITWVEGEEV